MEGLLIPKDYFFLGLSSTPLALAVFISPKEFIPKFDKDMTAFSGEVFVSLVRIKE